TFRRKIREAVLALRLTSQYTKDEILALYLNQVYYGHLAYGVEAAAQVYFGKPVRDLDIAECALLAGLPQAPALYDPLTDLPRVQERQRVVLDLMHKQGYITAKQADLAAAEPLRLAPEPTRATIQAPHFCTFVVSQLEAQYGTEAVLQGGLQVHTTLDLDAQHRVEDIVQRRLARLAEPVQGLPAGHHVTDAAVVALDPNTGEVLMMVGSPDYFDESIAGAVNVALSPRQPGSAIKPFTYAAALAQGLTPATVFYDVRSSFTTREGEPYVPENYDRQFHGPVSLRTALGSSLNVVAVQVLDRVGLPALIDTAQAMGIHTFTDADRYGLALTLGGGEVRLLELTSAYGVFATGGVRHEPTCITRVEDAAGRVLYQREPGEGSRVLPETIAYLITDILADDDARLVGFGEGSVLDWRSPGGTPAAVKTGTTTDWRDNWTVGYIPGLVVGVWTGNADGSPMIQVSGITGAAPIWRDVMTALVPSHPQGAVPGDGGYGWIESPGLTRIEVCPASGLHPGPHCPHRRTELFIAGTEPAATCDVHQAIRVCTASGQLATDRCPANLVETRVFQVFPSVAQDWALAQGIPQPPVEPCPVHGGGTVGPPPGTTGLVITSPDEGSMFRVSPALPRSDQRIALAARIEGTAAIAWVEFRVDGVAVGRATAAPWQVFWTLSPGTHTVQAVTEDRQGQTVSSAPVHFVVE
ncbi:MAG: transglycosylase domain-containing protein, partial [Chloroflexi bacterium]|nr:transglycosylase domain-containing protein [Chloroflexota bacterium]